jgi:transglutaminase-like putative cysteine protease
MKIPYRKGSIFLLCFFCTISSYSQLIENRTNLYHMNQMLEKQKQIASGRSKQLFNVFNQKITPDERQSLEFLFAYMPLSDLADYDGSFFLSQARTALKARAEMPWGKQIPEEEFLHFVLPPRVNNENLDEFRPTYYNELKQRVKGLSMRLAALEVNHWCHEKVAYRGSDERTSSPLASIRTSFGRCGEESTFTVAAMRTVGIPARQVYTPRWAHTDDNHAWVEVWIDGKWYFLGACEPESDLNMGWFSEPARRAMLVHTRAYGWYNGSEPVIQQEERFSELNLIGNYAPVKNFVVKVTTKDGKPEEGAKVEFQLYNYSEFYPIASSLTDKNGYTSITAGLGDLMIWAAKDNAYAYKKITIETTDTLYLQITSSHTQGLTENFDLVPPLERTPKIKDDIGDARNAIRLRNEDSIRNAYMATFKDSAWAANLATNLNINVDSTVSAILLSYGNWEEISKFLISVPSNQRPSALSMLSVISEKDLRDTHADILHDHFDNAFPYQNLTPKTDQAFFAEFIMSGRISNEMMIAWRSFLQSKFDTAFASAARNNIEVIIQWIEKNIRIDEKANLHSRAPLTPRGVYELRIADRHSRDIFFVALCRSLGIPSCIDQATSVPQYWNGNNWKNVSFGLPMETLNEKGFIHLMNGNHALMPKYAINFTLAKFIGGFYKTLEYDFEKKLDSFPDKIMIETGQYMLVTGNRQPDGSVLSSITFFEVEKDKTTGLTVDIRETQTRPESWAMLDTTGLEIADYNSEKILRLGEIIQQKGAVLVWIDPDKEPSKHVIVDITSVREIFERWGGSMVFLSDKNKTSSQINPDKFKGLPSQLIYASDKNNKILEQIEKLKGHELSRNLPVIVVSDPKGNLIYFSEGYKIGVGEQIAKEISRIK